MQPTPPLILLAKCHPYRTAIWGGGGAVTPLPFLMFIEIKKMDYKISAGILVILLLTGCVDQEGVKTYNGDGYSIQYPGDWKINSFGDAVLFNSPLEGKSDKFQENVGVISFPIERDLPRDNGELEAAILKELDGSLSDFKYMSSSCMGLPEYRMCEFTYSFTFVGKRAKQKQTTIFYGDVMYSITYTAEPESYDLYLPVADDMTRSFEVE